jgi:hypothetical protein
MIAGIVLYTQPKSHIGIPIEGVLAQVEADLGKPASLSYIRGLGIGVRCCQVCFIVGKSRSSRIKVW